MLGVCSARDGVPTHPARALARLLRAARPGAILALHAAAERGDREPVAIGIVGLLDELEKRRLRSVTVDELLAPADRPCPGRAELVACPSTDEKARWPAAVSGRRPGQ